MTRRAQIADFREALVKAYGVSPDEPLNIETSW